MTITTSQSATSLPAAAVTAAARALIRASRFEEAESLLAPTSGSPDPGLALARGELAVTRAYQFGLRPDLDPVREARPLIDAADDDLARWDLALLEVRLDFIRELFEPGTRIADPSGRDPVRMKALRRDAEILRESAPDAGRRGWASFYLGVILDNVYGERDGAPALFAEALADAVASGDDHLAFEALRHLGDHDHDDGDSGRARERWERSTEHAARAGGVTATLSQQLLLAQLARERGEETAALLLATEVARWAGATGATRLRDQAQAFAAGSDPTQG